MKGEAAEWLVALHDDDIEGLHHFDNFMLALRFKEPLMTQKAMSQIKFIRQEKMPIVAYIQKFWILASQ